MPLPTITDVAVAGTLPEPVPATKLIGLSLLFVTVKLAPLIAITTVPVAPSPPSAT